MSTPYLDGKIALVTGASRGLGLAIARGLRDAGATVIVSGSGSGTDSADPARVVASSYQIAVACP